MLQLGSIKNLTEEGFEPSSPKRAQLKCAALDHSAIPSIVLECVVVVSVWDLTKPDGQMYYLFCCSQSYDAPGGVRTLGLRIISTVP